MSKIQKSPKVLKISTMRMGGGKSRLCILRIVVCLSCAFVCACSKPAANNRSPHEQPVQVRRSLFYNHDSLLYYADLAYRQEDPQGLYVTAVASILSGQDHEFPKDIYTVPIDEAEIMLLRAAQLGHSDAKQLIRCLNEQGYWHHSIPE